MPWSFLQILLLNFEGKCMEISLEIFLMDIES